MTQWTLADLPDQTGKRWLITGATNGLGEATARAAAASITGDIDVLINNAGTITRRREETEDGFEKMLAVNFLGPFALTQLLLPQVRDRIVIVASDAHQEAHMDLDDPHFRRRRWSIFGSYRQSKLADMLWGLTLSKRCGGSGVGVQLVHPGWVLSNLQSAVGNKTIERIITTLSRPIAQSADRSALCSLFAATMELPECSYVGPDGFKALRGWPNLISRSANASDLRKGDALWEFAVRETGV